MIALRPDNLRLAGEGHLHRHLATGELLGIGADANDLGGVVCEFLKIGNHNRSHSDCVLLMRNVAAIVARDKPTVRGEQPNVCFGSFQRVDRS